MPNIKEKTISQIRKYEKKKKKRNVHAQHYIVDEGNLSIHVKRFLMSTHSFTFRLSIFCRKHFLCFQFIVLFFCAKTLFHNSRESYLHWMNTIKSKRWILLSIENLLSICAVPYGCHELSSIPSYTHTVFTYTYITHIGCLDSQGAQNRSIFLYKCKWKQLLVESSGIK